MGLFDRFKKTTTEEQSLPDRFKEWINSILEKDIQSDIVALNFNIYEDADKRWSVEVVGTSSFDENNDDWACDEITDFGTREKPFSWQEDTTWDKVLPVVKRLIERYLDTGNHSEQLRNLDGIGYGFVDGDLEMLYKKK